jgi:hypothetical protein
MPWNTPAVTRGQGRSSIMGAVAMLFLMIVTTPSALAEGSWYANYSGTGGTNCGFYFLPAMQCFQHMISPDAQWYKV